MKIKRKRYEAQFMNLESGEVKTFELFAADDCEAGTSGRGIAVKQASEKAVENGLVSWWSRVLPVRVTYKWSKENGCSVEKVEPMEEDGKEE